MASKQLSPRMAKLIGILMLIFSAAALCFTGDQVIKGIEKRHSWNKAIATVTRLEPMRGKKGRVSYAAWFSFRDPATNHSYFFKSKMNSNPPAFQRGQRVEVLYPSENPEEAVANSFTEIFFWALISGVLGITFGFFGYALTFSKNENSSPEPEEASA